MNRSQDSIRRRDGPPREDRSNGVSEGVSDWRSLSRPRPPTDNDVPVRRVSGFSTPEGASAADREETWSKGSKFQASQLIASDDARSSALKGRSDFGANKDPQASQGSSDWRSGRSRSTASNISRKYN